MLQRVEGGSGRQSREGGRASRQGCPGREAKQGGRAKVEMEPDEVCESNEFEVLPTMIPRFFDEPSQVLPLHVRPCISLPLHSSS